MEHAKRNECSACGTSDVNHTMLFISGCLGETIGRIGNYAIKIFSFDESHPIFVFFEKILYKISVFIGLIKYSSDKEKAVTGRSRLIWDEAEKRGIKMEQVTVLGRPVEHYRAFINGKYFHFESLPIPAHFSRTGYTWVDDKFILTEKFREQGISAPRAISAMTTSAALRAFDKLEKPVIVKPKSGSRGRHTTTNINTSEELIAAMKLAHRIAPTVVVEEHLFGSVYRATTVEGKLVGFFRADPPQVTGDGAHTVKELIEIKNKNRNERLGEIFVDDDVRAFLGRQNLNIDSILEKDRTVNLSAKTGRFYGGYTREMIPEVHPKIHAIFEKAAKITDIPVAGFDLIIGDPTQDPDNQKWGVIECNSMPFIDLHFFSLEGKPVNVAENVWDLWLKK